jgi:hypothetical protein
MSIMVRRNIPLYMTLVMVLLLWGSYFITSDPMPEIGGHLKNAGSVMFAYIMPLASITLIIRLYRNVTRKVENWYWSIYALAIFAITFLAGRIPGGYDLHSWIYEYFGGPVGRALYAQLGFQILSTGYMAFRIRNWEAIAVLIPGLLVVLGNAPIVGAYIPALAEIKSWMLANPVKAGQGVVLITMALGALVLGVRTILGLETGYLKKEA